MFDSYDFKWDQITAGTMDTEATMIALGRLLKEKCIEFHGDAEFNGCVDHLLELTTKLAFRSGVQGEETMEKCRRLVNHFTSSSQALEALKRKQIDRVPVGVIQDVVTRWWSTYAMGVRLLQLRNYISIMTEDGLIPRELNLSNSQWDILNETTDLLEPFMVAQKVLEGEKYVTISLVLLIITTIRNKLQAAAANVNLEAPHVSELSRSLLENFNKHWGDGMPGTVYDESIVHGRERPRGIPRRTLLATYLDPRTKDLAVLDNIDKSLIKHAIKEKLLILGRVKTDIHEGIQAHTVDKNAEIAVNDMQANVNNRALFGILDGEEIPNDVDESHQADNNVEELVDAELTLWEREPKLPRAVQRNDGTLYFPNPLIWWRKNENRFPRIASLAAQYLAIQATSASSERLFSVAGLTISKDRARLTSDNAAMLIFLHDNIDNIRNWRAENGYSEI